MAGFMVVGLGLVAMLAATNGEGATAILHSFAPDLRYPLSWLLADGAGYLYGTTNSGGYYESGALFKVKTDGTGFTLMHSFLRLSDGARPTSPLVADDLGNLYGMASEGGSARKGTVFTIRTDGSGFTVLHSFVGGSTDGRAPVAGLLLDGAGNLYGTTRFGGASDLGTVFTVRTDGSGFALLHSFADLPTEGTTPSGGLITDGAGSLFGVTSSGGASDQGTVFRLGTDGSGFTILHSFAGGAGDGASAGGGLFADGIGNLYGTTWWGGASNLGTVFRINADGSGFGLLHSFAGGAADGRGPAGLLGDENGTLYGMTTYGGSSDLGTVFTLKTDGSGFAIVHTFAGGAADGSKPYAGLVADGSGRLFGTTYSGGPADSGTVFALQPDGSDFTLLPGGPTDGLYPCAGLIADATGNLYGTTEYGGALNLGTVFRQKTDGSEFALLHSFADSSGGGAQPCGELLADGTGRLYGTTYQGGDWFEGTVFAIGIDGLGFSVLRSFGGVADDGLRPYGALVSDDAGNLYGTTSAGGGWQSGTVYRIRDDGSEFALIRRFGAGTVDGWRPFDGLVSNGAGRLFGTTSEGGAAGFGMVFSLALDGSAFVDLHSFAGGPADGAYPWAGLAADGAGNLYGTTVEGGAQGRGAVFRVRDDGSGFALLHSFAGGVGDGDRPVARVILDGAGNLFGMTGAGGASDLGTAFTLKTDGSGFIVLHSFVGPPSDGALPSGRLMRRGRTLYGTTYSGGINGGGTVFALVNPLWKGSDTPGIYRDSDRQWYLKNTNAAGYSDLEFPYGDPSDRAVVGDWDGDGIDTVGIYRGNTFYLRNSNSAGNADLVVEFGAPGDVPIAGDWDGDGIDTIGVYRPGEAAWFLKNSNAAGAPDLAFTYGLENETPVVGDWNADGIDTVGIFRASDRQWYLHNTNASGDAELVFPYGDPATDVPIVGDWDNDGTDTVGVYRPAQGEWFLKNTNAAGNADLNFTYGILNEKPVVGDWDGQ